MKKGIYCLENLWSPSVKDQMTVQPILELLEKAKICEHIHHKCATREELVFMLNKWKSQTIQRKFPILYFAFHGSSESIRISNKDVFTLVELGTLLEDKCYGKVFFFASCETMDVHGKKIQTLLNKTGAIAAIGYKTTVDWMKATAFELLVLNALQEDKLDSRGIENIKNRIISEYGKLHSILEFRMIINNNHFPRKRT
jgi:hypothetical protein